MKSSLSRALPSTFLNREKKCLDNQKNKAELTAQRATQLLFPLRPDREFALVQTGRPCPIRCLASFCNPDFGKRSKPYSEGKEGSQEMNELDLSTLQIRAQNDELSLEEVQQIIHQLRENRTASLKSAAPKAKATEAKPKVSPADLLNSLI
jgi:hypothetical protein